MSPTSSSSSLPPPLAAAPLSAAPSSRRTATTTILPPATATSFSLAAKSQSTFTSSSFASSSFSSPFSSSFSLSSSPSFSSSPASASAASSASKATTRLQHIADHIMPSSPSVAVTNFPAQAVPQAPEDPLFGLMAAYRADPSPDKVDLGIGAYRDNSGKPWVLPVVKKRGKLPNAAGTGHYSLIAIVSQAIRPPSGLTHPPVPCTVRSLLPVLAFPSPRATGAPLPLSSPLDPKAPQILPSTPATAPAELSALPRLPGISHPEIIPIRNASARTNPGCMSHRHAAETIIHNDPNANHEYLPIAGLASLTSKAAELILGADSPAIAENRTVSIQTISGTGAVHLGALFLAKFYHGHRAIYFSNPTWANHNQIFSNVNFATATYPYFDKQSRGLDFTGMIGAIEAAPDNSVILLHACAHNPTGVDPTQDQWKAIADVIRKKNHLPFFDCAYQGFASGDLGRDAGAVRYFVEQGFELLIAQSFAKNFGLYGERAGCFHYVAAPQKQAAITADTVSRVKSQLYFLQRSEISNPPIFGALVASTVLNDAALFAEWEDNLRTMSGRIKTMRTTLREKLEALGTPGTWNHITDQIGMFSFTGLTEAQVQKLRSDFHVYMTKNGRISMAGLNTNNIDYFAKSVDAVVRSTQ